MIIFITGATGFIGTALIPELLNAGHQVLGLTRSNAGSQMLTAAGARPHRGDLEDLESLRRGAEQADGVVHLGFNHDFSKFAANCETDRQAIDTLGSVLAGSNRPLIVTGGITGIGGEGQVVTEDAEVPANYPFPRVSEQTALAQLTKGVCVSVVRLPQVHDTVKQGLVTYAIATAREKGVSAYVNDGSNRWCAAHVLDTARLYRLALEKQVAGAKYHAVAEEGVAVREIAEAVGEGLKIPVVSMSPEEANAHFGFLGMFVGLDRPASSAKTREWLGWTPTGPGLIEDLKGMDYSKI